MERCPTCKARLKKLSLCPRCKTDLSRVFNISARVEYLCQYAIARLNQQDIKPAVLAIQEALQLQRSKLVLATQKFIVKQLEQQAVAYLTYSKQDLAMTTIELSLSLKKTVFASTLHAFIKQQKKGVKARLSKSDF